MGSVAPIHTNGSNGYGGSRSNIPPSLFTPLCHPGVEEARKVVDNHYLQHWPWKSEKAKKKFVEADFTGMTALLIPKMRDERLELAGSLVSITFLMDDHLEGLSRKDGEDYNRSVMAMCVGDKEPDRNVPAQWLMYDLFQDMRRCDKKLTDELVEPLFVFLRAMFAEERLTTRGIGPYLRYREGDIGEKFLAALTRYSMALHLSPAELESCEFLERNVAHHEAILNDICSYEKELHASRKLHKEGAYLSNVVPIFADDTCIPIEGAKRVLWHLAREVELHHNTLVKERIDSPEGCSETMKVYLDALTLNMAGNEEWCHTTLRYQLIG